MDSNEQKKVFIKIVIASIKNIIGFGLATALIGYLSAHTSIDLPLTILTAVVVFVMLVSLVSLFVVIFYTVRDIPTTLNKKPNMGFWDIYAYTVSAVSIRLLEASICVAYIVYLYRLYTI